MNAIPTHPNAPDELDRLLSDFFKSQLKQPWPKAPRPAAGASEPSELANARSAEQPRNAAPAPARADATARARFTLAASVALMLGTCWFLSSGYRPGERPTQGSGPANNGSILDKSDAKGGKDDPLHEMGKDKLKNDPGVKKPDVKLE